MKIRLQTTFEVLESARFLRTLLTFAESNGELFVE